VSRDPFVEWQQRFGREGTVALERLREVLDRDGTLQQVDVDRTADDLGWPVAAVAGAASFYADLSARRRGRRHVRVCKGTSCFVSAGGEQVAAAEAALGVPCGQTSPDGSVSLDGAYCLGYCYASPAILDNSRPSADADVVQLLGSRRPAPPVPYHSAARQTVLLAGLTGAEGSWEAWSRTETTPERVRAEVAAAGLRGRGGAEYPVAAKWEAAVREPAPRFIVANGDEGDPGSFCDRLLMESDPHRVLEGAALAGAAIGARRGFVFVRSEYPSVVHSMRTALAQARAAGWLGSDFDVEIIEGAGSYVAGEETALLRALQGLRGGARPRPPYPTTQGFAGQPTVVNNVETLAALPWILRHGGRAYARLGTREETGTKLVCLSQRFRRPGVYEVEFGVPLRWIIDNLGGGMREGHALRAVQVGGPLGGFLAPEELDAPLLASALADAGVALGHGSLVAVDDSVSPRDLLRHLWSFAASESCGACTPCRVGTRRGRQLAERTPATQPIPVGQERVLAVMAAGSLCAFGRGVTGAVRSLTRVYHDEWTPGGR
jgi:NADH:ubiquinone oxidoreductase subunit F (NADH-binding)/NADH:ubiquinone oxidoreductase subunit E